LQERLFASSDRVQFDEFFAATTNETPATSELFKDVLADLASEGFIEIRGKNGEKRRGRVQHGTDIVIQSRQKKLFLME